MKNIKVLVLEGGFNEEHEVSIATGTQVKKSLLNLGIEFDSLIVKPLSFENDIKNYNRKYICFNALHGSFGEDGQIQKILDKLSFKYTHSNIQSSNIGFNKILTKNIIKDTEILSPKHLTLDYKDINRRIFLEIFVEFGSFIIKPISSGSSFGIKIFKDIENINFFFSDLNSNLKIYKNHKKILVEKYIEGRELTVAVINKNNKSFSIEVTEIIPKNDFFDYKSKYTPGFSEHILPANIPKKIYDKCKSYAKIIHDKIDCKAVSRSDFIYDEKQVYFLEINTHPGLTSISLVPEQLKYQNVSFENLILNILECSL